MFAYELAASRRTAADIATTAATVATAAATVATAAETAVAAAAPDDDQQNDDPAAVAAAKAVIAHIGTSYEMLTEEDRPQHIICDSLPLVPLLINVFRKLLYVPLSMPPA